jgi:glycine cleavage system H protein
MEGFTYVDIFATKGIEYLLVIFFLLVFTGFWRFLSRPARAAYEYTTERLIPAIREWFTVPDGFFYHPGHAWAKVETGNVVTVGVDDFAQKLVGKIDVVRLPEIGTTIYQGDKAFELGIESKTIPVLAPVEGQIVAINKDILDSPNRINEDAYGSGWLCKVYSPRWTANMKNLLSGSLAQKWTDEAGDVLVSRITDPALGATMADGGVPVAGIAKSIAPDRWDEVAKEMLLTADT